MSTEPNIHGKDRNTHRNSIEHWLAVGGGWQLAVGGPWGLSLRAVLNNKTYWAS